MCANGSRKQDYEISYAPTADGESLRFMIVMASEKTRSYHSSMHRIHSKQILPLTQKINNIFPYQ